MNKIILIGRMVKDCELRYLPGSGTPVASFTLAVDRDYVKKDGTRDTDFIPVEVMGKSAEFCATYLGKGRLISLDGSLRVDNYTTKTGEKRVFTKVLARSINALDSRKVESKVNTNKDDKFVPNFEPSEDMFGDFESINDIEMPF